MNLLPRLLEHRNSEYQYHPIEFFFTYLFPEFNIQGFTVNKKRVFNDVFSALATRCISTICDVHKVHNDDDVVVLIIFVIALNNYYFKK